MLQELFLSKFEYLPDGRLKNKQTGKIAGGLTDEGYIRIRINHVEYRAHRIIWTMFNGEIPEGLLIDHINGINSDNRLENLRLATRQQNNANRKVKTGSKLPKGVTATPEGRYRARLHHNGTWYCLGTYDTPEQAEQAYLEKSLEIHKEFSIANRK